MERRRWRAFSRAKVKKNPGAAAAAIIGVENKKKMVPSALKKNLVISSHIITTPHSYYIKKYKIK
jgi:hypothetical protein